MIIRHNFYFARRHAPVAVLFSRYGEWRRGLSIVNRMLVFVCFSILFVSCAAADSAALELAPSAEVTSDGVYLQQIIQSSQPLPQVRLCDAPQLGTTLQLTPSQINDFLAVAAPDLVTTNWTGADSVSITRRTHTLTEADATTLLTSTLQQDYVKDRGQLELTFTEHWDAPVVPDEPLTVKILELPTAGVTRSFIARFELCTPMETAGTWDISMHASVWRDVWVAHSDLARGELVADADLIRDRRDVLTTHEALADFSSGDATLELANEVPADAILLARDLRLRTVIHRGQIADAILEDGALNITMKVEALEDGAPGQVIHVRNTSSLHDLTGKVLDDQTIQLSL